MSGYILRARDAGFIERSEISAWSSLNVIDRHNDVGSWLLKLPYSARAAQLLEDGAGLVLRRDDSSGTIVMSGPVRRRQQTDDETGSSLEIAGLTDNVWIARRLAHPQPDTQIPPYATTAYDVRTGQCSSVLRQYVDWNLGFSSLNVRTVNGLTLASDPALGSSVTGRARWQPLLQLLQELAIAGGDLGFRIRQSGAAIVFSVYQPTDRSASVVFDMERGNLKTATWSEEAPTSNYVYCGGSGDGTARVIREGQDSDSISRWGRVETFRDRRDTSATSELDQSITDELEQNAGKVGLSLVPIDTATLAYGTHYDLGDKVTAVMRGQAISDVIREVSIDFTPEDGIVVTPTIGTPGRPVSLAFIDNIRRAARRITNLERN